MIFGGIDLGGTKIEARLFEGVAAHARGTHRIPTPKENFDALIDALAAQVRWLETEGSGAIPIGITIPGVIDPVTGISTTANIPAMGRKIGPALATRIGRHLPLINDCMAFALSEAQGGAADGAETSVGLILGTGMAAGHIIAGEPAPRHAGFAVEIGHVGMSARALARHKLPIWTCGCGRDGCMERYVSGTGLSALARHVTGREWDAAELAASPDPEAARVLDIWADLAGECLYTIQLMLDPHVIVLGGGLSNLPGITERLGTALAKLRLGTARAPDIRIAQHGDSSGARGAALLALQEMQDEKEPTA